MKNKLEKLSNYADLAIENNPISLEDFKKYNVKRGLRNSNGTGVLVGLTGVGDVKGYEIINDEKKSCKGELFYRGIEVADLIKRDTQNFDEVTFLLLFGRLPTKEEYASFREFLISERALPNEFKENMIFNYPSKNIMNQLHKCVLALYTFDDKNEDLSLTNLINQSISLIAKLPIILVYSYFSKKHKYDNESLLIHQPNKDLKTAENIFHILRRNHDYTTLEVETLDMMMTLHAEHGGGNNSTFATHVLSSSGTDTYSIISSAIGSLNGPKHGGANKAVHGMMAEIKANITNTHEVEEITNYLKRIMDKQSYDKTGLIYGLGHPVYTLTDPRAELLRAKAKELAISLNKEEAFNFYYTVEIEGRKLLKSRKNVVAPTNIDFYSSLIFELLGIPKDLYTPFFAISRLSGWCAHRIEQVLNDNRVIRPAYKSIFKKV